MDILPNVGVTGAMVVGAIVAGSTGVVVSVLDCAVGSVIFCKY